MLTALLAVAGGLLGSASSPPVAGRGGGLVRMVANLPADSASSSSDDDLANNTPLKYHTFGGALRPLRPLRLAHMEPLPRLARQLISPRDRLILSFVLEYLQTSSLGLSDVALHISGGYVRDLLLGRKSDDLDLSLCLRELHPNITIDTVACGMPDFALERPDLGIEQVEVITCLSEASRGKSVDAAQVRITISSWEEPTIVDLMPTIGKETYDANDRIPRRDVRGTAEEDTLRRDLTICALLLRVTRMEVAQGAGAGLNGVTGAAWVNGANGLNGMNDITSSSLGKGGGMGLSTVPGQLASPVRPGQSIEALAAELERRLDGEWVAAKCANFNKCVAAAATAASLQFRLLDFHSGVDDLQARVLRSPYPRHRSLSDVWEEVILSPAERQLADRLGLSASTPRTEAETREMLQVVWWAKVRPRPMAC